MAEWPKECCGLLLRDRGTDGLRYAPMVNVHPTPTTHYEIARTALEKALRGARVMGVVHSHPMSDPRTGEGLCPSEADTAAQLAWGVPFYVVALSPRGTYADLFGWGDQLPTPPLRQREFRHAVTDCYALVRHAMHRHAGVILPDAPRALSWWSERGGPNPIEDGLARGGFAPVPLESVQPGDGLLFSIRNEVIQHCGLYLGGDLFMHHLHGRLSSVDPLPQWRRFLRKAVRFAPGAR